MAHITVNLASYTEEQLVHYLQQTDDPQMKNLYSLALERHEPLLKEDHGRYVLFPIQYPDIWSFYEKAVGSFWTVREVSLADDIVQWKNPDVIDDDTKHFIKNILAFFASFDAIVGENLAMNFYNIVQIPEIRCFYGFQIAIEHVHNEMYSLMIDAYIDLKQEKDHLFNAMTTIPIIKKMADWALKWLRSEVPFNQRIVAFACIEAIMFSGAFCSIFWLKKKNILPGLCTSNEFISRDEGLHAEFASLIYSKLKYKASDRRILDIVIDAVNLQMEFINETIPCRLIGMNSESMSQYIKFVADRLLVQLGCDPFYNVKNPFDWMDLISMENKTNFFEKRVSEYSRAKFTSSNKSPSHNDDRIDILQEF